jgi:hypothetical protein
MQARRRRAEASGVPGALATPGREMSVEQRMKASQTMLVCRKKREMRPS